MSNYFFYDLETTGLNKAFDQVLQFAAIRTDMVFNEIERHEFKVAVRPDIIPSPSATITHRLSIKQTAINEFEAITQIHSLINKPGTISIGYNTLGFDDEFLRFSFHRNLLPPYTHQYKDGCRRSDLLPITIMYYLYKKEALANWPEIDGKSTMSLEHLNTANQLAKGQAHNAMTDVEACVELARRFYKEPRMWRYLDDHFDKIIDKKRIEDIPTSFHSIATTSRVALLINNKYGVADQYQIPVLLIGNSIPYKNQTLWLRLDNSQLREITTETFSNPQILRKKSWVIRKKYGEPGIVLSPIQRYWDYLTPERQSLVEENKKWLQSHTTLFYKIIQYHREFRYPKIPDLDIEAALYQKGFLPEKEQALCRQFHHAISVEEKVDIVNRFEDIDMRKLASRLLCRNYPADLSAMFTRDFTEYMQRVNPDNEDDTLQDHKQQKRTTPVTALQKIKQLHKEAKLDEQQLELLKELENYIKQKFNS